MPNDQWLIFSILAATVPAEAFLGFGHPAVITVACVRVLSQGWHNSGAVDTLTCGALPANAGRLVTLGDLVEIDGHYGRVDRITLRSTRVVTPNGRMLAVPNTIIINKTVASYTNFPSFRVDVDFTVGVNEDLDSVRRLLLSLLKDDAEYMVEPAPRVVVTALNDYNVAMALQAWIHNERLHGEKTVELREKVFKILTKAGVEMPFETMDIRQIKLARPQAQSTHLTNDPQRDPL